MSQVASLYFTVNRFMKLLSFFGFALPSVQLSIKRAAKFENRLRKTAAPVDLYCYCWNYCWRYM